VSAGFIHAVYGLPGMKGFTSRLPLSILDRLKGLLDLALSFFEILQPLVDVT